MKFFSFKEKIKKNKEKIKKIHKKMKIKKIQKKTHEKMKKFIENKENSLSK